MHYSALREIIRVHDQLRKKKATAPKNIIIAKQNSYNSATILTSKRATSATAIIDEQNKNKQNANKIEKVEAFS